MWVTRRQFLPASAAVGAVIAAPATVAAFPLRVVATADGPYIAKVIELGDAGPAGVRRAFADYNQDRYIWEIG